MKNLGFTFTVFILGFISFLAACNVQSNTPLHQDDIPIETQANAWQLLPGPLDIVKSNPAALSATVVDSLGNPVIAWSEASNIYVKRWTGSDWQPLGGSLDVFPDQHASAPDIALDKTGQPIVSWYEWQNNTTLHVYVKRWNGTTWVQLGTKVDAVTSESGYEASLAVDRLGNPIVALTEVVNSSDNIYVKRWDGTNWVQFGSALDIRLNANTSHPTLALDSSGNPIVAWEESEDASWNIYVKRWNGTAWLQVGGVLDIALSEDSFSASLAVDTSGKPVVAWEEGPFEQRKVYVKRWTGNTWSQVGTSALNITTQPADRPSLALDNTNQPIVAWQEFSGIPRNVYIRRWNGTSWVNILSNPLDVKASHYASNPSLALDSSGNPVVAWSECFLEPSGVCVTDVYVKRYVSNGWKPLGKAVDISLGNAAMHSSLARKTNDRPVVVWQEMGNIYTKEWNGTGWLKLGNKLNTNSGSTPMIAMRSDDKPVVAWSENNVVFVKFWNGSSWQSQGSLSANTIQSFALVVGSANNPIVAYSAFGNDGEATNLYLQRWNGSAWVGMNGSNNVTALDIDITRDAAVPTLGVDSTGKPIVAWVEFNAFSQSIFVKRWTGTAWVQLGANLETFPANNPSLAVDSTGKPVVAWEERVFENGSTNTNIYAKRWSGSSWVKYETIGNFQSTLNSGEVVDKLPGNNAYDAILQLRSDDAPVIAITQSVMRDGVTSFDIYVRRWLPSQKAWVDVGVPIDNNIVFSAKSPSLVLRSNNNPIISWDEFDSSSSNVYVSQY